MPQFHTQNVISLDYARRSQCRFRLKADPELKANLLLPLFTAIWAERKVPDNCEDPQERKP